MQQRAPVEAIRLQERHKGARCAPRNLEVQRLRVRLGPDFRLALQPTQPEITRPTVPQRKAPAQTHTGCPLRPHQTREIDRLRIGNELVERACVCWIALRARSFAHLHRERPRIAARDQVRTLRRPTPFALTKRTAHDPHRIDSELHAYVQDDLQRRTRPERQLLKRTRSENTERRLKSRTTANRRIWRRLHRVTQQARYACRVHRRGFVITRARPSEQP